MFVTIDDMKNSPADLASALLSRHPPNSYEFIKAIASGCPAVFRIEKIKNWAFFIFYAAHVIHSDNEILK